MTAGRKSVGSRPAAVEEEAPRGVKEAEVRSPMTEAIRLAPDVVRGNLLDLIGRRASDGGILLMTPAEVRHAVAQGWVPR
jgi:hypothetical protein